MSIAEIVLEISPDAPLGATTPLRLQEVQLIDADNAAIPISTVDGILTIEEDFVIGDTNENGFRDLGDAIKLMRFLAELEIFTDRQQQAADLNGNGIPDLGDLIKLLRVLAELETLEKPIVDISSLSRPHLEGVFGQGKGSDTVELILSGRDWAAGAAELLLHYDADQLLWIGYELPMDDAPHALTVVNGNRPGAVKLLRAHLTGSDGAVDIGRLQFRRLGDAAPAIEVASFSYVDLSGRLRPTDKAIQLQSNPLPESITLYPNLPNPFNPETTIRFAMPATDTVRLAIFDLMGQEIRILVEGFQPAGQHSAIWDGRDDAGRAVSSGVYFYRLSNEKGRYLVGKMLLLR